MGRKWHVGQNGTAGPVFASDEWFFLAVSLENGASGTGTVRLTVNDKEYQLASQSVGNLEPMLNLVARPTFLQPGDMDELAVFHRALTPAEIASLRRRGMEGKPLAHDEQGTVPDPGQTTPPPLATAPFNAKEARADQEAWAKHLGVPVEYTNKLGMKFQLIPPGEFTMGVAKDELPESPAEDPGGIGERAGPAHRVRLTKPYYIGEREVKFSDFALLMKDKVGKVMGVKGNPDGPVMQYCNWLQCVEFCNRLSEREGLTPAYAIDGKQVTIAAGIAVIDCRRRLSGNSLAAGAPPRSGTSA